MGERRSGLFRGRFARGATARGLGRDLSAVAGFRRTAEEGRGVAHFAVFAAQDGRAFIHLGDGLRLLDGGGGFALLVAVAARAVVAVSPAVAAAFALRTVLTGTIIAGTIVTRPVVSGTIIAGTVVTRAVVTGTVAVLVAVTLLAVAGTIVALAVALLLAVAALVAIALLAVAGTIVTLAVVTLALFLAFALAAVFGGLFDALGAALFGIGLEVDVKAGGLVVAAEDFAGRTLRLHGAQGAEVVFGVLQVVLGENPVPGRGSIAGELLVALEDALGGAADLDVVGSVRLEGAVGVVLRLAPTAAAIAAALTLHALEISHECS